MKKLITCLLCLSMALNLGGCNTIYSNYIEIEQLLVIETMGLDLKDGQVQLSLASTAELSGDGPRLISASGSSVSSAMERAYRYSYEEELFCSQVNHVLMGEAAAEAGIGDFLAYICRSPLLRIDMPLYVVRGSSAQEAIMNAGDKNKGISEIMQTVQESLGRRGEGILFTAADVARDLYRHGSALICALEYTQSTESGKQNQQEGSEKNSSGSGTEKPQESAGQDSGKSADNTAASTQSNDSEGSGSAGESSPGSDSAAQGSTLAATGYAVIRDGKLCKYLSREESLAVSFMLDKVGIFDVEVTDRDGQLVVLQVDGGSSKVSPVWSAPGQLKGLDVQVQVQASVLEISGQDRLKNGEYTNYLTAQLEGTISQYVSSLLHQSQQLQADFLGLSAELERSNSEYYRLMSQPLPELLPSLELEISVSGQLVHSNDIRGA